MDVGRSKALGTMCAAAAPDPPWLLTGCHLGAELIEPLTRVGLLYYIIEVSRLGVGVRLLNASECRLSAGDVVSRGGVRSG